MIKYKSIASQLREANTILTNVTENETVKADIAGYGYVEDDFARGVAIHSEAETLHMDRLTAGAEQKKVGRSLKSKHKRARNRLTNFRGFFRDSLYNQPEWYNQLRLDIAMPGPQSDFLVLASHFYETLLRRPQILDLVPHLNLTVEKVQAEMTEINVLKGLHVEHRRLYGVSQRLVYARNEKLKELKSCVNTLAKILHLQYDDTNPQTLEEIGVFVRNAPKRSKSKDTEPTDPTDPTTPTDPTDPTTPTDPTDPTTPTDPTDPTDPTTPTDPTEPITPPESATPPARKEKSSRKSKG